MRELLILIVFILFLTIIFPITLIKGYDIIWSGNEQDDINQKYEVGEVDEDYMVNIYDTKAKKVITMEFDEYIKGVVAAEVPGGFEIEAIKAQAVAARSFSIYRLKKYSDGHPDHPQAALCNSIHCQAFLSKDELRDIKGRNWMYEYWPKIEEAVESTKGEVLTYDGKVIEPLFHSTSGGMTENSEDVFVSALPYLRAVDSPYESESPKLNTVLELNAEEFIKKLKGEYPSTNLTVDNLDKKIVVMERSEGGKIIKVMIDNVVATGREIRSIFALNSTNFKISMTDDKKKIKITTIGNGHGVGMSQWGANGMAENGSSYNDILKHYYTGVEINKVY
ncbi:stage II sporulation protein D [Sporosalibacterium faouarense]|uniref:stage II sporulation protein D n=1 Tax=Sporosalibacterium faouarense TaxID=516123 RepID=UPI00141CC0BB|nr:stage II sporulation protein D [Sporosalibacterium faouarense]MTI46857.1 stage II sporulation protein D [Bacillota bacterium]